jgi:hypothetical protein
LASEIFLPDLEIGESFLKIFLTKDYIIEWLRHKPSTYLKVFAKKYNCNLIAVIGHT